MANITLNVDEQTKEEILKLLSKKKIMTIMNIRVDEDTKKALETIAKEKDKKPTTLARQILETYVKNYNI